MVRQLSTFVVYVQIVDKGQGELWGLYRTWVWDTVRGFLRTEGYEETRDTEAQATAFRKDIADGKTMV